MPHFAFVVLSDGLVESLRLGAIVDKFHLAAGCGAGESGFAGAGVADEDDSAFAFGDLFCADEAGEEI